MQDDDRLRRDLDRAARADRLINDELLQEGFDKIEAEYIAFWRDSAVLNTEGREKIWQGLQILGKVKNHLAVVLRDGAIAAAELNQLTK